MNINSKQDGRVFKLINIKMQQIFMLGFLLYPGMLLSATTDVWVESEKLQNTAPIRDDWFGYRLATNTDTLAVGCPRCDSVSKADDGKVILHTKDNNGRWVESQVLAHNDLLSTSAGFGSSIVMNDKYLIIGAPYYNSEVGAVFIYSRTNGNWSIHSVPTLTTPGTGADHFGYSLALYEDPVLNITRLLVGAPGTTSNTSTGNAYLFEIDETEIPILTKTFIGEIVGDWFGFSVDLDADRIVIGAPFQEVDGIKETGNVYLYEKNLGGPDNWGLKENLFPSARKSSGNFGYAVKIENDIAVVSAFAANIDPTVSNNSGAGEVDVYRFDSQKDNWPYVASLVPTQETVSSHFGAAIDIENAKIAVSMLVSTTNPTPSAGAVYLFQELTTGNDDWTETAKLRAQDGGGKDELGSSIVLKPNDLFTGAHKALSDNTGAVYVFSEVSNTIPELTAPQNLTVYQDQLYNESVSVFDADNDPVSVVVKSKPTWLTFDETTLTLTGTPGNDDVGINLVVFEVSDGISLTEYSVSISVINVNDPPVVDSIPITGAAQDQPYSYTLQVSDPDVGDTITITPVIIPGWAAYQVDTKTLFGTPTSSDVKTFEVSFKVDDGLTSVDHNFIIDVNNVNDAPVFTSTPLTVVKEDTGYSYVFTVVDYDLDVVSLNTLVSLKPDWLTMTFSPESGQGVLSGTPPKNQELNENISIVVYDGQGGETVQSFILTVENVNDFPEFISTPITSIQQDQAYLYKISVIDPDLQDTNLTVSIVQGPAWLKIANNSLSGIPTNDDIGIYSIILQVDDNNGLPNSIIKQSFELEVINVNDPPVFSFTPIETATQDLEYELTVTAFDLDEDTLTLGIIGPAWLQLKSNSGNAWFFSGTPLNADVGIYSVTLQLDDKNGLPNSITEQVFELKVINVNDAPVFISKPVTSVSQDELYSYSVNFNDIDANDTLSLTPSFPYWMNLDENNVLSGVPGNDDVGIYEIVLSVSDGMATTTQTYNVEVIDKPEGIIGFAETTQLQGIEGADTSISIKLIREGGSYGDVSVDVSQVLGLDEVSDVEITPSTVMWANEDTSSKTIVLKIIDDTEIEGQEEILLQLAIASGTVALSEESSIKIIIEDNDFEIIEPLVEPVAIKTLVLPKSMAGKDYSTAIQIVKGTPPYQISWEADVPGLKFDGSNVSGIPSVSGDYNIKLRIEDSSNPAFVTNAEYVLVVKQALQIDVDKLNFAIADNDYSFQFKATGGDPVYTWKNDAVLPQGLTLQSTGFLSGTPTEAGDHQISLVVEDQSGFSTQGQFEIKVLGFGLQNDTPVLPAARVGLEYHAPLLISGGSEPYVCEVVEGDLPGGIDMNACQISGTPATPGDYDFVIGVVDLKNPALGRRDAFILRVREPRALAIANATAVFNEIGQEDLSSNGPGKGHVDEVLTDMATDAFGNHYVVGHAYNKGNYQVHLLKYAADKTLAWHQVFDSGIHDYIYSVAISPDQSVYIAGFQLEGNRYGGLIVKYSHKGVKEWERTYSGIDNTDNFYGLIASNNAVYVVGESYNGYDFDAIILKYSANGEQQWTQKYLTSNNDTAYKIQLVSCESELEKECEALLVAGTSGQETKTGWLLSLNAHDGGYRAEPLLFGDGLIKVLEQDRDRNVIVGGDRTDSGWLIAKVANDLNVLWNISYQENNVTGLRGIAVDPDGFIYVAGNTRINGNSDAFIGVLNDNGNVHQTFLLEAPDNEYPRSLVIDANLRLIVSGHKESKSGSKFLLWEVDYGGALQ